jgi:hypothetical protein
VGPTNRTEEGSIESASVIAGAAVKPERRRGVSKVAQSCNLLVTLAPTVLF